jgi:hypothetical protein
LKTRTKTAKEAAKDKGKVPKKTLVKDKRAENRKSKMEVRSAIKNHHGLKSEYKKRIKAPKVTRHMRK